MRRVHVLRKESPRFGVGKSNQIQIRTNRMAGKSASSLEGLFDVHDENEEPVHHRQGR